MVGPPRREDVPHHAVDLGVAAPASLVGRWPAVAEAREDETVPDALDARLVVREPGDRPDRAGDEEEAVRVPPGTRREQSAEKRRHDDTREVVVAEGRVTRVARDQHLVGRAPGEDALAVGQVARLERRVDADLILVLRQRDHVAMAQAESPVRLVVGRAVGDPVGMLGQRVEMWLQLRQRHARAHRTL
jgi:hypothetical protein